MEAIAVELSQEELHTLRNILEQASTPSSPQQKNISIHRSKIGIGEENVIEYLREHGVSSRSDIERSGTCSRSCVSNAVDKLRKLGVIQRDYLRGRRNQVYYSLTDNFEIDYDKGDLKVVSSESVTLNT